MTVVICCIAWSDAPQRGTQHLAVGQPLDWGLAAKIETGTETKTMTETETCNWAVWMLMLLK